MNKMHARLPAWLFLVLAFSAQAQGIQPYVLAYTESGPVDAIASSVKSKLVTAGFEVVGEYAPYPGAHVVAVTNDAMKAAAAKEKFGGFGAVEHVAVTEVSGAVQVSYLNLPYLAAAYHLSSDLASVALQLQAALGAERTYGTDQGRTLEKLRKYNYMFGMEHYDDFYKLGRHRTYEEAVSTVQANLENKLGGAGLVYKVEIPGTKQTIFGVSRAEVSDQRANDKHIMADTVDRNFEIKTTPYLPYQILVNDRDVVAMHMRFRLAVWHPDLTMGTFSKLMSSPGAIEELLEKVAGGEQDDSEF